MTDLVKTIEEDEEPSDLSEESASDDEVSLVQQAEKENKSCIYYSLSKLNISICARH
jgi:hypothetical protein